MIQKIVRLSMMLMAVLGMLFNSGLFVHAEMVEEEPVVSAQNAIVLSADTGEIIFEKSSEEKRPMASTTKIMTALLALEEIEATGNPVVEINNKMVPVEGSSMGLQVGDLVGLEGIVGGMMMSSGNDAAQVIAIYLGGTVEEFAEKMNIRAAQIGMKNTHFVTASGLDADEHYSTAYDMALLGMEATKNKKLREISASESIQVTFESPQKTVPYKNHNKLLWLYEDAIGIKTGFTRKSGRCLVSAAERDGVRLVAVTLNAPNDWDDHAKMLDYSFSQLTRLEFDESSFITSVPTVGGDANVVHAKGIYGGEVNVRLGSTDVINRVVKLPKFMYADVKKGDTVGRIEYYSDGKCVHSLPIKAIEDVNRVEKKKGLWEKIFHRE